MCTYPCWFLFPPSPEITTLRLWYFLFKWVFCIYILPVVHMSKTIRSYRRCGGFPMNYKSLNPSNSALELITWFALANEMSVNVMYSRLEKLLCLRACTFKTLPSYEQVQTFWRGAMAESLSTSIHTNEVIVNHSASIKPPSDCNDMSKFR